MGAKITDNYLEFNGVKYFRGKSENIEIGAYGEKKDGLGTTYLAVQSRVRAENLSGRVRYFTTADIEWEQTNSAAVEANGKFKIFGLDAKVGVEGSYAKAKSAKLKLIKLGMEEGALTKMLNSEATGARKFLADEGGDARIVSEVWIVVEAVLAEHFASSGSVSAGVSAAGSAAVDVTASGGKQGSQTVTLSKGTTFAYMFHKVKTWNKDKSRIEDMEDDSRGMR